MMFSGIASLALRPSARMVPSGSRVSRAAMATMAANPSAKCTTSMGEFTVELVRGRRLAHCSVLSPRWRPPGSVCGAAALCTLLRPTSCSTVLRTFILRV